MENITNLASALPTLDDFVSEKYDEKEEDQLMMTKNWKQELKDIDAMFMHQANEAKLADIEMPKLYNDIALYPYQEEAVRWMYYKETMPDDELPPFWKFDERTKKWRCDIPCKFREEPPTPVRGGILADGE